MDNYNNFIYAIRGKFIVNELKDQGSSTFSFVSSNRSKIIEKIYNLYEKYKDVIKISVEIWFDEEDELYNFYYPRNQVGKPMTEITNYYEQELKKYEKDLIKKYQNKHAPLKKPIPTKIYNGILTSCERLFKDENAKNHYKASFNFDVFNTETNEKYDKCTVSFPNLVSDCYLEDFLGLSINLLDITVFAEIKDGFEEKVAIEVTMK